MSAKIFVKCILSSQYHPLEEIYGWFDYLESTYDFCETEIIGETYEGRQMIVMKVRLYLLSPWQILSYSFADWP